MQPIYFTSPLLEKGEMNTFKQNYYHTKLQDPTLVAALALLPPQKFANPTCTYY